jgi:hypothetical protein
MSSDLLNYRHRRRRRCHPHVLSTSLSASDIAALIVAIACAAAMPKSYRQSVRFQTGGVGGGAVKSPALCRSGGVGGFLVWSERRRVGQVRRRRNERRTRQGIRKNKARERGRGRSERREGSLIRVRGPRARARNARPDRNSLLVVLVVPTLASFPFLSFDPNWRNIRSWAVTFRLYCQYPISYVDT